MPSASSSRHWARAWSRGRDRRGTARRTAVRWPGSTRGRPGRAVAAAEQVRRTGRPTRSVSSARPGPMSGCPPVARRIGGAGEGVDDDDLGRVAGPRAVVPVGDGQLGQDRPDRRAGTARAARTRAGRSRPAAPAGRAGGAVGVGPRRARASSRRADEVAVGLRRLGGRPPERLVEVGDEVVDVLEADRQPDEVRRRRRSRPAPSGSSCECVVEAGWMISDLASPTLASRREDLDVVDELAAGLDAALDPERHDPAEAALQVARRLARATGCDSRPG